jgi:phosphatidylinositol kinase/protein kinase (PI-3  family)
VPEILPFRLTKNLETTLGAFKSHGLFTYYFIQLNKFFAKNIGNILGALDSFVYDPLIEKNNNFNPNSTYNFIKKAISFEDAKSIEEGSKQLI